MAPITSSKQKQTKSRRCNWVDICAVAWLVIGSSLIVVSIVLYNQHIADDTLSAEKMELRHWKLEVTFLIGLALLASGMRLAVHQNFLYMSTPSTLHLVATVVLVVGDFIYMSSYFFPTGQLVWQRLQLVGRAIAGCGFVVAMVVIVVQICAPESAAAAAVGGDGGDDSKQKQKRGGESSKVDGDHSGGNGKRHGPVYIQL